MSFAASKAEGRESAMGVSSAGSWGGELGGEGLSEELNEGGDEGTGRM